MTKEIARAMMIVLCDFPCSFSAGCCGAEGRLGVGGTDCVVVRTGGGVVALSGSPQ